MKSNMIVQAEVIATRAFDIGQEYRELLVAIENQTRLVGKLSKMANLADIEAATRARLVARWESASHKLNNMLDAKIILKSRRLAAAGELVAISRK